MITSLIIDTSSKEFFIGLSKNGIIIDSHHTFECLKLSKFLLPSIATILQGQIPTFIAVGKGPGTFTGTRLGAIVAQTLAYAWNIPLVDFSSSLLPDLPHIAHLVYKKYLKNEFCQQIDLVYISSST